MKKKLYTALLTGIIVVSVSACGSTGTADNVKYSGNPVTAENTAETITHSEYSGYEDVKERKSENLDSAEDVTFNGFNTAEEGSQDSPGETKNISETDNVSTDGSDAGFSDTAPEPLDEAQDSGNTDKVVQDDVKLDRDKIIYTCDMSISVENFDDAISDIEALVDDNDGIIEQSSYTDCSDSSVALKQYKEYKIRIPNDKFDSFIDKAGKNAEVMDKSTDAVNVTQDYNDYAATLDVYETKYKRYKELLSQATEMEDILSIEESLADTQEDINWIKTRMNQINTDVAYSYVYLTVEDIDESKNANPTFADKISNVFKNSWSGFLFKMISILPYIILLGGVAIATVLTVRKVKKVEKKREEEKEGKRPDSPDK